MGEKQCRVEDQAVSDGRARLSGKDARFRRVLRSIIATRAPELMAAVDDLEKGSLTSTDRERLEDVLADELIEGGGITVDDEVTPRGLLIEDLIGWLNRT
jgi:hypothetical protein